MKHIRAWMSLKFNQIRLRPTELAALERLKKSHRIIIGKRRQDIFSGIFHRILFILAGSADTHKSLDEFEIRRDQTTDYGVSCP